MKPQLKFILALIAAFAAGGLLIFYFTRVQPKASQDAGDTASASPVKLKRDADGRTIVVLDADTQKLLGLETAVPEAVQQPPAFKAFGHIIDPAAFAAAVSDLESARTAAIASTNEYERLKNLAEGNNVSARNLEAAQATATHDESTAIAAETKFIAQWGKALATPENGNLRSQIIHGEAELVQVDLNAGEMLSPLPKTARFIALGATTNSVTADFFDTPGGVDAQSQGQVLYFVLKENQLPPGAAVTALLQSAGDSVNGVVVPFSAVLRHEGKSWIYRQTGGTNFSRLEISTDEPADNGYFVSGTFTNPIVTVGAQAILSAELSSGNFSAGTD